MAIFSRSDLARENAAAERRNQANFSPLQRALQTTITPGARRRVKGFDLGFEATTIDLDAQRRIQQNVSGGVPFGAGTGFAGGTRGGVRIAPSQAGTGRAGGTVGGVQPGTAVALGGSGGAAGGIQDVFNQFIAKAEAEAEQANRETAQRIQEANQRITQFEQQSQEASGTAIRTLVEDTRQREENKNAQILRATQEQFAQAGRGLNPRLFAMLSKRLSLTSGDVLQRQQSELELDSLSRQQRAREIGLAGRLDILSSTRRQTVDPSFALQLAQTLGQGAAAGQSLGGQTGATGGGGGAFFGGGSTRSGSRFQLGGGSQTTFGSGTDLQGNPIDIRRTAPFTNPQGEEIAGGFGGGGSGGGLRGGTGSGADPITGGGGFGGSVVKQPDGTTRTLSLRPSFAPNFAQTLAAGNFAGNTQVF